MNTNRRTALPALRPRPTFKPERIKQLIETPTLMIEVTSHHHRSGWTTSVTDAYDWQSALHLAREMRSLGWQKSTFKYVIRTVCTAVWE